jgi:acetate kinase
MTRLRPDLPSVACFDTAFHADLPAAASTYALPEAWARRWQLRRYGFHGLSHAYASRRAAELLDRPAAELRLVSAHLGAGASLAAIAAGRSVDTTMGFTPLEGLVMATRSGSVDPGLLLWVQREGEIDAADAELALETEAGLLGLSGRSGDLRDVLAAADDGDQRCRDAFAVYLHRLVTAIGAMAAALDGIDALVFTGGVGENSPFVRSKACGRLGFLGVEVDRAANEEAAGDRAISPGEAPAQVLVVEAREDLEIAGAVRALLDGEAT